MSRASEIAASDPDGIVSAYGAKIIVGGGEYLLEDTEVISASGSYGAPIIYTAAEEETPEFIGGCFFNLSEAAKVTDEAVLNRLSDKSAADFLYEIDLTTKIRLEDIPKLALPGVYSHKLNGVTVPDGKGGEYVYNNWVTEDETTCEVFLEDEPLTPARYPNNDYIKIEKLVDAGANVRYWEADKKDDESYVPLAERDINDVVVIGYDNERFDNWTTADQALMFGYWYWDWAVSTIPLASVDADNNTLTAKYPSYYSAQTGQRFYVYNLLEEIDSRGEYFIDRSTGKLYFYRDAGMTDNKRIFISLNDDAMIKLNNVENVILSGFDFTVSRGNAISAENCRNVTISNCEISNTATTAVEISGSNNIIENCHIYNVDSGIFVSGGDLPTLTHSGNIVRNNKIENFSRVSKLNAPAINIWGVGGLVTNNEINNSEHSAIFYSGAEHIITYNNIYDVCKEADDAGAIYAGRKWLDRGNVISYNYIHDLKRSDTLTQNASISGVFMDDHYAGTTLFGNIFANIDGNGIKANRGRDLIYQNNIFAYCTKGLTLTEYGSGNEQYIQMNNPANAYYKNDLWKTKYPHLYNILEDEPEKPKYNVYKNNILMYTTSSIDELFSGEGLSQSGNKENIEYNPGFKDIKNGDFSVTNEDGIRYLVPDFEMIDFSKIGICKSEY